MPLDGLLGVTDTDDAVEFEFSVENTGVDPLELAFRSGQLADVVVETDNGAVWQWSEGQLFTQARQSKPLAPGETLAHEMTWPAPRPGEYGAEASLEAANATLLERTVFEVPDGL